MKICSLNVCGLNSKNKFTEFRDFLNSYDVCLLQETKLSKCDVTVSEFDEFKSFHKIREKGSGGGLTVLIKNHLYVNKFVEVIETNNQHVMWVRISKDFIGLEKNVYVGNVYVPPEGSRYGDVEHFVDIESEWVDICANDDSFLILGGDFNSHSGNLNDLVEFDNYVFDESFIDSQDELWLSYDNLRALNFDLQRYNTCKQRVNNFGNRLVEMCKNLNLLIANGRLGSDRGIGACTWKEIAVDDYVLASARLFPVFDSFNVWEFNPLFSDGHSVIDFSLKTVSSESSNTSVPVDDNVTRNTKAYGKWKPESSNIFVNCLDNEQIYSVNMMLDGILQKNFCSRAEVDEVTNSVNGILLNAAKATNPPFVPNIHKTDGRRARTRPRKCVNCVSLKREFTASQNTYRRDRCNRNRAVMYTNLKKYKKHVKACVKKEKKKFVDSLRSIENPREFWKVLGNKSKKSEKVTADVNALYEHFRALNQKVVDNGEANADESVDDNNDRSVELEALNADCTEDEVRRCLSSLKLNKACGLDQVTNEFIKCSEEKMVKTYVKLFNVILKFSVVPECWSKGMIIPIYKNKGDKVDPNNYRGITLLSCLGKMFTTMINARLTKYLEDLKIISPAQAGFRSEFSTIDHSFTLKSLVDIYLSFKRKLYVAFIDYQKAFDTVWRAGLWSKLLKCGVKGRVLNVIKAMYSDIKSCISCNGEFSEFFACNIGVRQGENLSPALFSVFLSDIEEFFESKKCQELVHVKNLCEKYDVVNDLGNYIKIMIMLYADDTIMVADTAEALQKGFDCMFEYCKTWKLKVNASKTKVIIFWKSDRFPKPQFKYGEEIIEIVQSYTYLGTIFTSNGCFLKERKHRAEQASKAMFSLLQKGRKFELPLDLLCSLFDKLVSPVLLYGAEVWGHESLDLIERVQHKFLRLALRLNRCVPSELLLCETGRLPLAVDVKCKIVQFWARLLTGSQAKLSYQVYQLLLALNRNNVYTSPWINCIRSILNDSGYGYLWVNQEGPNKYLIKNCIIKRLRLQAEQTTLEKTVTNNKCRTYRLFKHEVSREAYLDTNSDYIIRIWSEFRLGTFSYRMGTLGRCKLCNVENHDEFHILLECQELRQIRTKFLPDYYCKHPNIFKFQDIMQRCRGACFRKRVTRFLAAARRLVLVA